ncbi:hypothetical protein LJC17_01130 [Acholeplasma sp. OttesenSCG-928-E16]|nr:hypothetical protein [Acholeplasma sp. OttesenSCG-928-E16]
MENSRVIQTILVNNKESISLYTTFFEVVSRKRVFKKKRQFNYEEIESISLQVCDPNQYVKSEGIFAILNIKIKRKASLGFDFFEPDVRNLKHHTSVVVAFVGSMKACIEALSGNTQINFIEPIIEIIEPEILDYETKVSYQQLLGTTKSNEPLENDKLPNSQKLLK